MIRCVCFLSSARATLALALARLFRTSVAFLSALANALKVASTMWWEFLPSSCGKEESQRPACNTDRKVRETAHSGSLKKK